jgi:disulfide bond formation protein DsbB
VTRRRLIAVAGVGSLALLVAAWVFQAAGYAPCKMCVWQRWPHAAAAVIAGVGVVIPLAPVALLGALAAFTTSAIGVYHAGVEVGLWEGPSTCTSSEVGGLTTEELMDQIMTAPLVRCDEVAWQFMGISMAGWNALLSFGLVLVWLAAWRVSEV